MNPGYNPNKYSLLDDQQFQTAYGTPAAPTEPATDEPFLSKDTARAAAYGAQSGGLSGALTSGGVTSALMGGLTTGNAAAMGGGLILSQIEARQKEKAAKAQAEADAENKRRDNMVSQYTNMANLKFGV